MTLNKLFKYSTILLLFMTSGVLIISIALIDNFEYRYKIFEIFQIGSSELFELSYIISIPPEDSYFFIAPIVNLLSGIFWSFIFVSVRVFFNDKTEKVKEKDNSFWRETIFLNFIISLTVLIFWLITKDVSYKQYESISILKYIIGGIFAVFVTPTYLIGWLVTIPLEEGAAALYDIDEMNQIIKITPAFGVTFWSIFIIWIKFKLTKYIRLRKEKGN